MLHGALFSINTCSRSKKALDAFFVVIFEFVQKYLQLQSVCEHKFYVRFKFFSEITQVVLFSGDLVDDKQGSVAPTNEKKFSSSTIRYNSLGTLRKRPNISESFRLQDVYVIGLTGGMASGKSSVAKHMENHGAVVIDCDKLGHIAYEPGTEAFAKVVERFGREVVSLSGTIDRKVLASKVFGGDSQEKNSNLTDLNAIVWPEIERLARGRIAEAAENKPPNHKGKIVCVLDAAVLLEVITDWLCVVASVGKWLCFNLLHDVCCNPPFSIAPLAVVPLLTSPLLPLLLPFLAPGRCYRTLILTTYQFFYLSFSHRSFAPTSAPLSSIFRKLAGMGLPPTLTLTLPLQRNTRFFFFCCCSLYLSGTECGQIFHSFRPHQTPF